MSDTPSSPGLWDPVIPMARMRLSVLSTVSNPKWFSAYLQRVSMRGSGTDLNRPGEWNQRHSADIARTLDSVSESTYASMLQDLLRGNRLELPWLSGAVAEQGRQMGIPVPRNRAVADILALSVDGQKST